MAIKKITELDALTSLTDDDLFVVVNDPSGMPVTKKIAWEDIVTAIGAITALTGDVTATGPGSSAAAIANKAVTLAKMADMATASLLGRNTAGSGTPEVLNAATVRSILGLREKLTANRTYYVRTDGNDSNDGLSDSSGGAFLTIQKAVDTIANTLDIGGYTVTVQIKDGTYTSGVTLRNVVGYASPGNLVIQGNSGTPANVKISTTSADCFVAAGITTCWDVKNLKVQTTTSGNGINVYKGGYIRFSNIDFGVCANSHIIVGGSKNSIICAIGNYSISGNAQYHINIGLGDAEIIVKTITFTSNASFTIFAINNSVGMINIYGNTYNLNGHTVTGQRYYVGSNAYIYTGGGGENYFPGDSPGSSDATGLYA